MQLANAVSADAWMNVPVMADDNYITRMATLVHSQLGESQKIYVELSNEVWNSSFSQFNTLRPGAMLVGRQDHRVLEVMNTIVNGSECAPHKCVISGNRSGVPTPGSYVCSARRRLGASRRPKR